MGNDCWLACVLWFVSCGIASRCVILMDFCYLVDLAIIIGIVVTISMAFLLVSPTQIENYQQEDTFLDINKKLFE